MYSGERFLYVVRHGAVEESVPVLGDFNRSLSPEGVRQTLKLLEKLRASLLPPPDLIVSSSALRARQTATLLNAFLSKPSDVLFLDTLYLAPPHRIFRVLDMLDDIYQTVLLIGHHPGLSTFLDEALSTPPGLTLNEGACVVLQAPLERSWAEISLKGFKIVQKF